LIQRDKPPIFIRCLSGGSVNGASSAIKIEVMSAGKISAKIPMRKYPIVDLIRRNPITQIMWAFGIVADTVEKRLPYRHLAE